MRPVFDPPAPPLLPLSGEAGAVPVARIFCVGRNYAAHAAEMGNEFDREAPFYFTKSALHLVPSGATVPYPPATADLHHEMELAVVLGSGPEGGAVPLGAACALDMTRRDLQAAAKERRRPWDLGKDFEGCCAIGPVTRDAAPRKGGDGRRIALEVNGTRRQDARLSDMIHDVPAILADLGRHYALRPGDVILTGTPAGVGPVVPGDVLRGSVEGLEDVHLTIGAPG